MSKKNKKYKDKKQNGHKAEAAVTVNRAGAEGEGSTIGRWRTLLIDNWVQALCLMLLIVGMCAFSLVGGPSPGYVMWLPAPESYRSPVDFEYFDRRATRERREQARYEAPLVFRDNRDQFEESVERLENFFDTMDPRALLETEVVGEDVASDLAALSGSEEPLFEILYEISEKIVLSPFDWGRHAPRDPDTVILQREDEEDITVPSDDVMVLSPYCEDFAGFLAPVLAELHPEEREAVKYALVEVLPPTARLNMEDTDLAAEREAAAVEPAVYDIKRGDILIREGEVVGIGEMRRLRAAYRRHLAVERGGWFYVQRVAGILLIFALFGWIISFYLRQRSEREVSIRPALQCFVLLLMVLVLFGAASFCVSYGFSLYLIPLSALVMIMALVFGQRFSFIMAAFIPAAIALLEGSVGAEYPVFMAGGMVAALLVGRVRTRGHLIRTGVAVGLIQAGVFLGFALVDPEAVGWDLPRLWETPMLFNVTLAFGNGLLSGVLVTVILPVIERVFEVATDIRLLEWSDPNQPLLKRLLLEAPGTYHHSMLIGSLAAEAAEAVGANPLLTRVSAYFHDVGKLKKPQYFAENMEENEKNPHDDLAPTMSKLIITAHPRDGAEMARKGGLPPAVRDVILQSHGTTKTSFFWERARNKGYTEDCPPPEDSFRYKLPKPHNKEAACVMLADAVESITRALQDPGAAKIAELVHQTILDRLHDRQLDDSGLTIPDLARLENALNRGLTAVFHKRVKYPGQEGDEQDIQR